MWVATASYDAGVGVGRLFPMPIHHIDPDIDAERDYIARSLAEHRPRSRDPGGAGHRTHDRTERGRRSLLHPGDGFRPGVSRDYAFGVQTQREDGQSESRRPARSRRPGAHRPPGDAGAGPASRFLARRPGRTRGSPVACNAGTGRAPPAVPRATPATPCATCGICCGPPSTTTTRATSTSSPWREAAPDGGVADPGGRRRRGRARQEGDGHRRARRLQHHLGLHRGPDLPDASREALHRISPLSTRTRSGSPSSSRWSSPRTARWRSPRSTGRGCTAGRSWPTTAWPPGWRAPARSPQAIAAVDGLAENLRTAGPGRPDHEEVPARAGAL